MSAHRPLRRTATLLAVLGTLLAVTASPVMAQTTLSGEEFFAEGVWGSSSDECDPNRRQVFTFRAEGMAVGPYPGTFTETGTFVLLPQGNLPSGRAVLDFHAEFTITVLDELTGEPTGEVVTGRKELFVFEPRSQGGACFDGPDGEARGAVGGIALCYRAVLPDGSVDTGVATGITLGFDETGFFQESFLSDADRGLETERECRDRPGRGR